MPRTAPDIPVAVLRCRPKHVDAVLHPPEQLVQHRHHGGAGQRPRDAVDAADDRHREHDDHQRDRKRCRREGGQEHRVEAAADAREERRQHERQQAGAQRGHARRLGGHDVVAVGPRPQARSRPLVDRADQHRHRQRAEHPGEVRVVRDAEDRARSVRERARLRQDVHGDHEQAERGDRGGRAGQPHQREARDQCEHRRRSAADDQRRDDPEVDVREPAGQVLEHDRLVEVVHRHDRRRVGADGHEGHVPERDEAGVPREHLEAHDHHGVDAEQQDDLGHRLVAVDERRERRDDPDGEQRPGDRTGEAAHAGDVIAPQRQADHRAGSSVVPLRPRGRRIRIAMTAANTIAGW